MAITTARSAEVRPGLAICLHGIESRSFAAVRRTREELDARGVDRVTLAVVPAADLHPLTSRAPQLVAWLRHRVALGDAVAQQGLTHRSGHEFRGLDLVETGRRVGSGRALLREIELDPRGFIAGDYRYTAPLREYLAGSFTWFAERDVLVTAALSTAAPARRLTRLPRARPGRVDPALCDVAGGLWRLDLHPGELDRRGASKALAQWLDRAATVPFLTLDEAISPHVAG